MATFRRHGHGDPNGEGSSAELVASRVVEAFAPHRLASPAMMARMLALMAGSAAVLVVLWLALPHPSDANEALMAAIAGCGVLFAMIGLFGLRRALPIWVFHTIFATGNVLVTGLIYFSGEQSTGIAFLYVWIGLYVSYFFSLKAAAVHMVTAAVLYAVVLSSAGGSERTEAARWLLLVGTLVFTGVLVGTMKAQLGRLIGVLSDYARKDPLTGLLNRRGLQEAFELEVARMERQDDAFKLCLLVGDLDRFKEVNDMFGHKTGDEVLARAAAQFRECVRKVDTVARVGGDELAVIAPGTDLHGARSLAERIRGEIHKRFNSDPIPITISIGVARLSRGQTLDGLMNAADQALYAAKDNGRDRSLVYDRQEIATLVKSASQRAAETGHMAPVQALAETLDVRDIGTMRHSLMVATYVQLVAEQMDMPSERCEHLRLAAVLHDVGKIGVPDSVLRKSGPLDDDEWRLMRRHPQIGAQILEAAGLRAERDIVLAHHERPDGRGYPLGLSGEEIPLEARILSVADAYETMTSDRPYRRALGDDAAREELLAGAGSQFDPVIVKRFLRVLDSDAPVTIRDTRVLD